MSGHAQLEGGPKRGRQPGKGILHDLDIDLPPERQRLRFPRAQGEHVARH